MSALIRRALRWLLRLGAWGLATALALGWLGALAAPLDSFSHLRLHLVALAALAVPVLIVANRFRSAGALAAAALGSVALAWPFWPGLEPRPVDGFADLTVAQLNMRFNNPRPALVEQRLRETGADVLLLQEVSEHTMAVIERLENYPHRHVCGFRDFRGLAVVSRVPFRSVMPCARNGGFALATLDLSRPVSVVSFHAYWPWPWPQWRQLDAIAPILRAMSTFDRPLVIAGDFNAVPWSAAVGFVEEATNTRAVPGLRYTFSPPRLQRGDTRRGGLPIDHVLLSPGVELLDIRLMRHAGSDHLGQVARLRLR